MLEYNIRFKIEKSSTCKGNCWDSWGLRLLCSWPTQHEYECMQAARTKVQSGESMFLQSSHTDPNHPETHPRMYIELTSTRGRLRVVADPGAMRETIRANDSPGIREEAGSPSRDT